jgi:hypothetical protein
MKQIIAILFIVSVLAIAQLQAQTLYVNQTNGSQNSFPINEIRKLTFSGGTVMSVIETSGSSSNFQLKNLSDMMFTNKYTSVSQNAVQENNILLFPNPVTTEFQLSYQTAEAGNLQLDIINIQGKVVLQQNLITQIGMNIFPINVMQLQEGLYVCRIQNGSRFENLKFIKNK